MNLPEKGFYYHYKHDPNGPFNNYAYEVIGTARLTEERSYHVLYHPLYENEWLAPADYHARPLEMFMENVTVEGESVPRFIRITDPKLISKLEAVKVQMYGA